MLACLDLGSRTLVAVEHARRFGINVLAGDQAELARRFSTKDPHPEKWDGVAWEERAGAPRIDGTLIWLACELRDVHDGGDHAIATGRVLELDGVRRRAADLPPGRVPARCSCRLTACVVAARSASRKMTSAETAMIPVSRRTIASAISRWRSFGSDSKSRPVELALGGAGARRLGEQRDERAAARRRGSGGRCPRGPRAAGSRRGRPGARPPTWATRSAYQKPTDGRRRSQAMPPHAPAIRLVASTAIPSDDVNGDHRPQSRPSRSEIGLLMRKVTM